MDSIADMGGMQGWGPVPYERDEPPFHEPWEGRAFAMTLLAINNQIKTLLKEGATIYACRFAMGALYGFREDDLLEGIKPFNPLDVLDSALTAWRAGAFQINTWTV